jgi:PAS domain S-box-containing protein
MVSPHRSEESSTWQAGEPDVLEEIARTIGASLELRTTLEAILTSTRRLIAFDMGEITLWNTEQQSLVSRGALDAEAYHAEVGATYRLDEGYTGWIARHRHPLLVRDIPSRKDVRPKLDRPDHPFRSYLGVPIEKKGEFIGTLELISYAPSAFSSHDQEVLQAIGLQAAVAIENARLYQEAQRRAAELASLIRVSATVTSTLNLEEVLETIVNSVLEVVGCQGLTIFVLDEETRLLRLAAARGLSENYIANSQTLPLERGGRAHAAAAGEPAVVENIAVDPSARSFGPLAEQENVRAFADLPLKVGEQVIGMLSVLFHHPHRFTESEHELLAAFADQAAVAIENARLYARVDQELRRRASALSGLQRVGRELSTTLSQEHILRLVLEEAMGLEGTTHCAIILREVSDREWELALSLGYGEEEQITLENYLNDLPEESAVAKVARTGRTLRMADTSTEGWAEVGKADARSILLAPIWYGEGSTLAGMILLGSTQCGAFDAETQEFVEGLAAQAAIAIGNARRYQEQMARNELLRKRADQLSHILEVSQALRSNQPLEEVLEEIAYAVQESGGFDLVVVSIKEESPPRLRRVAAAGLPVKVAERMKRTPQPWEAVESLMRDEFRIGRSYYIPAEEQAQWRGALDVYESEAAEKVEREPDRWHPQDLLIVPLLGPEGEVWGILSVDEPRDGQVPDIATTEVLEIFAAQAAAAIENARLYDEIRHFSEDLEERVEQRTEELADALKNLTAERDRVEALYGIASELSASLDLDHVLNRTLDLVAQAVQAEQGTILLYDPEKNQLIRRATLGFALTLPPGGQETGMRHGEGLAGWIIEHGDPAIVRDLSKDPRWTPCQGEDDAQRACLAVPLGTAGEMQGVLLLYHHIPGSFTEDHLRLVEAAASQVSNTISNTALYGLIRDQAEELGTMLKQQQVEAAKSQAILEGVADGVVVTDEQGRVILFNAAAERALKTSRHNVLGRNTRELLEVYEAENQTWLEAIDKWAGDPADRPPGDFTAERLEVGDRVVSAHTAPVTMGGEYLGTVSVFRDVTAEVEAARAKSEFVSTVSHELRTPMTSIKGYADLLLMGTVDELNDQQRHFVSVIQNNADRLTSLVNDLLDISRIEAGRVKLEPQVINFSQAARQVVRMLEGRALEKDQTMEVQLPEELPPVWGDSDRVAQILTNLLANAIQYTPDGGRITLSACTNDGMLEVSVTDTGIGISEEDQAKIFERFFRADAPLVQKSSGAGLGLSITASLVRLHGGEMWVGSELGEGSTFTFTLPLAREAQVASLPLRSPRILVVEDNRDVANLIRIHLESGGHEVIIAEQGEEAIRLAKETRPDLITLDIRLPDADGFVVLQKLKEVPSTADIPVVIVSVVPCKEEGLRLGAMGYVGKPIDEEVLLSTVQGGLERSGIVLVVDDDQDTLRLVEEALTRQGLGVRTTRRGQQALEIAQERRPALILLDMRLEDMDGYQVLRKLKSHPLTWDIPIVVMTGSLTQEELKREGVLALGAERFLTKPFAVEELIQEITAVLKRP